MKEYIKYLKEQEKSEKTIEKYIRDINHYFSVGDGAEKIYEGKEFYIELTPDAT